MRQHAGIDVERVRDPHVVGPAAGIAIAPHIADRARHGDGVMAVLIEGHAKAIARRFQRVDIFELHRAGVKVLPGARGLGAIERLREGFAAQIDPRAIGLLES